MKQRQRNYITEATRRTIFDSLRVGKWFWAGRLDDAEFLSRIFDLASLPSSDSRHADMSGDVWRHRLINPEDWPDDWVFSDDRLDLMHGPDETFLKFLCEMVHPVVRDEADVDDMVASFNRYLASDGYRLAVGETMSGRRIFIAELALAGADGALADARRIADALSSSHVAAQITRMRANIVPDASLAIGSSKEFVESLCKGILDARRVPRTGKEDFPGLVSLTREALSLKVNPKSDATLRSMLGALGTITNSIAELRGQVGTGHGGAPETSAPPAGVARLAVNVAVALGVFLWETHEASADNHDSA
ncbi:abortive infection family protein [Limobrevibacterium gyesilva]|uniref:Abortive infection family protein n=1 Tax=Limobrevibacterium gyesilva TaxID=2991712 RepID=A0AA41YLB2_9PROT|nr:abortive infection family protein [Limobrevibacterium gyesilva]MCW3474352.1 abortive infection family protein [Limobrevibacterium gyesilva]